jgi:multidrug resistance efflux pump
VAQAQELARRGLASERALEEEKAREALVRLEVESLAARDDTLAEREMAVAQSEVRLATNTLESARARLANREVRAPIAGKAIRYEFVVGELVKPDTVLYEVFGGERMVLKLRVPERFATLVRPGQPYRALLQPYRGLRRVWFEGRVEALRDLIETEANRSYRVAYCTFDPGASATPPGTTAEAWIDVGRAPLWRQLLGL